MAFLFRLETRDSVPAEPPTLTSAVPNWRPGDTIPGRAGHFASSASVSKSDRRAITRPCLFAAIA